jgi:hypothetical protein
VHIRFSFWSDVGVCLASPLAANKIRELLAHPEDVEKAHEAIAERVGKLKLEATNENGKRMYLAHGKVDFFGEEDLAHSGGAGGPAWTERLPVHFGWVARAARTWRLLPFARK